MTSPCCDPALWTNYIIVCYRYVIHLYNCSVCVLHTHTHTYIYRVCLLPRSRPAGAGHMKLHPLLSRGAKQEESLMTRPALGDHVRRFYEIDHFLKWRLTSRVPAAPGAGLYCRWGHGSSCQVAFSLGPPQPAGARGRLWRSRLGIPTPALEPARGWVNDSPGLARRGAREPGWGECACAVPCRAVPWGEVSGVAGGERERWRGGGEAPLGSGPDPGSGLLAGGVGSLAPDPTAGQGQAWGEGAFQASVRLRPVTRKTGRWEAGSLGAKWRGKLCSLICFPWLSLSCLLGSKPPPLPLCIPCGLLPGEECLGGDLHCKAGPRRAKARAWEGLPPMHALGAGEANSVDPPRM